MMATGIALTAAAPTVLILGYLLSSNAYDNCIAELPASHVGTAADLETWHDCNDAHHNRLYVLAAVAVVMAGAGVPMIFVGAHKVRHNVEPQALLLPYAGPERAGLSLHVSF